MLGNIRSLMVSVFLIAGFVLVVTTREAHAYIDLSSGSFLIQVLLASLFASLFTIKLAWHKLTSQFGKLKKRPRDAKPGTE